VADKPLLSAQVTYKDAKLKTLRKLYKSATERIIKTVTSVTNFERDRRAAVLAQVDDILGELDEKTQAWFREEVEDYYKRYGKDSVEALKADGFPVKAEFTQIDSEAIDAMADEIVQYQREAYSGIKREVSRILNNAAREQTTSIIAEGKILGETRRDIADRVAGKLKDGLTALVDKGGRRWSFEAYSDMLTRTKLVEASNNGLKNRLAQSGYDLVQVSEHATSCPLCEPWQGKILSISGNHPDYPTDEEAKADNLWHPNCRHRLLPYHEKLAETSAVWNAEKGRYIQI